MSKKIKNIVIVSVITVAVILLYIFFIKSSPDQQNLISAINPTPSDSTTDINNNIDKNSTIAKDFLYLLLSVNNIKLNDTIFSNKAFNNLKDSSIPLDPPTQQEQGRVNPFAPLGNDPQPVNSFINPTDSINPVTQDSSITSTDSGTSTINNLPGVTPTPNTQTKTKKP